LSLFFVESLVFGGLSMETERSSGTNTYPVYTDLLC